MDSAKAFHKHHLLLMTSRTENFWNFLKHQELYTPEVEQLHGSELEKMAAQFKSMEGYSQSYGQCKREVKKHHTPSQKRTLVLLKHEMFSNYDSGRCVNPTMHLDELTYPRAPTLKPGSIASVSFKRRPRYLSWSLDSTHMNASGCHFGLKDPVEMAAKHIHQVPQLPKYSSHQTTSKLHEAYKEYDEFPLEENNLGSLEQYSPPEYCPCPRVVECGELSSCGPFLKNQNAISPTCQTLFNTHIPSKPSAPKLSEPNCFLAISQAQYNRVILRSYKSNHRSPFHFWGVCRSSRLQRTILRIKNKLRRGSDFKRLMGGRKFGFSSIEKKPYSMINLEESVEDTYSSEFLEFNLESELTLVSNHKEEILFHIMPTMKAVFASLLSQYAETPQEEYERAASDLVLDVCLNRIDFFTLVPRWEFLGLCADLNERLLQEILWDCMLEGRKIVDEYRSYNGFGCILSSLETDLEDEDVSEGYSSFEGPEEVFVQTVHLSDAAEGSCDEKVCDRSEFLTEEMKHSNDDSEEQTIEEVEDAEDNSGRWTEDPYITRNHSINPWIESTYELGVGYHRADESNVDIEASDFSQALLNYERRSSKLSLEIFADNCIRPGFFDPEDEKETRLPSATECNQILGKDSEVSNVTEEPINQSHPLGPVIQYTGQELTNYKNSEICETSSKVTIPSEGACAFSAIPKNEEFNTGDSNNTQGVIKEPLPLPPASTFKKTVPGRRIRSIVNQFDSVAEIPGPDLKPGG